MVKFGRNPAGIVPPSPRSRVMQPAAGEIGPLAPLRPPERRRSPARPARDDLMASKPMALTNTLILRRPPPSPAFGRPKDRLRGRLEGRSAQIPRPLVPALPAIPVRPARHLAPPAGRGRKLRIARLPGEGQLPPHRPAPRSRKEPSPGPSPRQRGEGARRGPAPSFPRPPSFPRKREPRACPWPEQGAPSLDQSPRVPAVSGLPSAPSRSTTGLNPRPTRSSECPPKQPPPPLHFAAPTTRPMSPRRTGPDRTLPCPAPFAVPAQPDPGTGTQNLPLA
jgi:hypothetical protein